MDRGEEGFLFPIRALSKVFCGKFVAALDDLRCGGWLPPGFTAEIKWRYLKCELYAHDSVVYAKQPLDSPQAVLDYLGRYTHRVAISNERIFGIDGNDVPLWVRADATSGKKRTLRIAGTEFFERILLHVLPAGFKRIRHYGLLSPARKKAAVAGARSALGAQAPQSAVIESVAAFPKRVARIEYAYCPHCGCGQFRLLAAIAPQPIPHYARAPP